MRLFRKQQSSVTSRPSSTASTSSVIGAPPPVPVRTSRHDELYEKVMAKMEQEGSLPSDEMVDKRRSFRHGSVVMRLDQALAQSRHKHTSPRPRSKELAGLLLLAERGDTTDDTTSSIEPTPLGTATAVTTTTTTNDVPASIDDEPEPVQIEAPKELSVVLASPRLRFEFRNFLRKRIAAESLLMFEAIELYENVPSSAQRRVGEGIVDQFVKPLATHEVNISGIEKQVILEVKEAKAWDVDTFRPVQRELYHLMTSNFLKPFVDQFWPGGILLATPGVFAADMRREGSSTSAVPATKGSGARGGRGTDVSTLTNTSAEQHIHDEETAQSLAYLEV